jgi:hypothetical protein
MKKIFAILGTALLAAAVLTGCSNAAGGNDGKKLTPEQQMLGEKLAAVGTANQAAFNKLQELSMKASGAGGFEQSDIESAIKLVAAIEPKVADLKTKATEYLNKNDKAADAGNVETACTDHTTALGEVINLLKHADTTTNKGKISEANTKFGEAYQKFGEAQQKLAPLFQ